MASQSLTADSREGRSNKLARTGSAPAARSRDTFSEFLASARTLWPPSTNSRVTVLPNTPVAPVINMFTDSLHYRINLLHFEDVLLFFPRASRYTHPVPALT